MSKSSDKPVGLRVASRNGQRGFTDGVEFWSVADLQRLQRAVDRIIRDEEAMQDLSHPTGDLTFYWWQRGRLARLLAELGAPPDPPIPHRLEAMRTNGVIDEIFCWSCDVYMALPWPGDAPGLAAWQSALDDFLAAHPCPGVLPQREGGA